MRTHMKMLGIAIAAITLAGGAAGAQGKSQEKGHGKLGEHGKKGDVPVSDIGERVPPGLAKKPAHMPPGQYKKRYGTVEGATALGDILRQRGYTVSRVTPYGESQYVYYRLRDGAERRALVSTGADRLRFSNVPSTILQAVLAQLY